MRVAATSTGKLFVGAYNPDILDTGALFQIDLSTKAVTKRLELRARTEVGASLDGSRIYVGEEPAGGSQGATLHLWDAATDSFRSRLLNGAWQDFAHAFLFRSA